MGRMSYERRKPDSEEENASEASHDARLQQLCLMVGVAIMHDIRMVVREELERYMEKTEPMNYHSTMMCIRQELERVGLTKEGSDHDPK